MGTHQIRYHRYFPLGGIVGIGFIGAVLLGMARNSKTTASGYDPETVAASRPVSDTNRRSRTPGADLIQRPGSSPLKLFEVYVECNPQAKKT
jgi:hypothetical protein